MTEQFESNNDMEPEIILTDPALLDAFRGGVRRYLELTRGYTTDFSVVGRYFFPGEARLRFLSPLHSQSKPVAGEVCGKLVVRPSDPYVLGLERGFNLDLVLDADSLPILVKNLHTPKLNELLIKEFKLRAQLNDHISPNPSPEVLTETRAELSRAGEAYKLLGDLGRTAVTDDDEHVSWVSHILEVHYDGRELYRE